MAYSLNGVYPDKYQALSEDGERVLCRAWRRGDGGTHSVLVVSPAVDRPSRASLERLTHEFGLKDELNEEWAVRPLELVRDGDRTVLMLEDDGGEPLDRLRPCRWGTSCILQSPSLERWARSTGGA
jgi:hypothetical protein